jgi:hypothetical protein
MQREIRKNLQTKINKSTGVGPPSNNEGSDGDITIRTLGHKKVMYVKDKGIWYYSKLTPANMDAQKNDKKQFRDQDLYNMTKSFHTSLNPYFSNAINPMGLAGFTINVGENVTDAGYTGNADGQTLYTFPTTVHILSTLIINEGSDDLESGAPLTLDTNNENITPDFQNLQDGRFTYSTFFDFENNDIPYGSAPSNEGSLTTAFTGGQSITVEGTGGIKCASGDKTTLSVWIFYLNTFGVLDKSVFQNALKDYDIMNKLIDKTEI